MESIDVKVLRDLHQWRASGYKAMLVTIVRTWGSLPRPVGAMMALRSDGLISGSVSGGCIEDDLIVRYVQPSKDLHQNREPTRLVQYGVSADEAHRFGLPCGGTLELWLEFDPSAAALQTLLRHLDQGQLIRRTVMRTDGAVALQAVSVPEQLSINDDHMANTIGPAYRMLLIGSGALSEYLATMALFNGFSVTVCDPREDYVQSWSVAGVHIIRGMPDDAVIAFRPDLRTSIVALSHDPKLDDLALLEALRSPAFYIGAIGSRKNTAERRARLITHFGETEQTLRKLKAPVGIYIGSKTPAEIAVSVMAEIIAAKNGVDIPENQSIMSAKSAAN